jgi:nitroreductase
MIGEGINDEDLISLVEAARWAQSSYDNQPWRYKTLRGTLQPFD